MEHKIRLNIRTHNYETFQVDGNNNRSAKISANHIRLYRNGEKLFHWVLKNPFGNDAMIVAVWWVQAETDPRILSDIDMEPVLE